MWLGLINRWNWKRSFIGYFLSNLRIMIIREVIFLLVDTYQDPRHEENFVKIVEKARLVTQFLKWVDWNLS